MRYEMEGFASWEEVLAAARAGVQLYYAAPLDAAPPYPAKTIAVVRVYKNGKLRIDPLNNQADCFTADAGHLNRFFRRARVS